MENKLKEGNIRQIIIETDGDSVLLKKAEVSGSIELTSILKIIIQYINTPREEKITPVENPPEIKVEEEAAKEVEVLSEPQAPQAV